MNIINVIADKNDLGLNNVDNTSDLNKPISNATQTALNGKEDKSNKSTNTSLGTSDTLYPTQNAVKTYVDSQLSGGTPDATALVKGKVKLAGDLGGTADSPTVPELANKEPLINAGTISQYYRGDKTFQTLDKTAVGLSNVDNTSDANKPISSATQTALNTKQDSLGYTAENAANKSTSTSLGTSDTLYPTQNAVKVYTDNLLGSANALVYKGVIDCSSNPNYPAANAGELYIVSVAGKIGGASGEVVEVGDMLICNTDSTPSGNQSTVGAYWNAIQKNINGAVTGAASSVNNNLVLFDGTTGKVIKDSGIAINATSNYITKKDLVGNIVNSLLYDNGTSIGLGVTTPNSLLHVSTTDKNINANLISSDSIILSNENSTTGQNIIIAGSSAGNRGVFKAVRSRGTLDTPTSVTNGDQTVSLIGGAFDGTNTLTTAGITFLVDNTVSTNNAPQAITFSTGSSTRSEKMRISSDGKIGINTTSLTAALNVSALSVPSTNEDIAVFKVNDSNANLSIQNSSSVDGICTPTISSSQANGVINTALITQGYIFNTDDSGTIPVNVFRAISQTSGFVAGSVVTRPLFDFRNNTTSVLLIAANGNVTISGTVTGSNLSGTNTGDESQSTIKTKLGAATNSVDGYLTSTDWNTFNNKQEKNITLNRQTASYTLVAGDNGKMIEMNVATANTLTINASIFSAGNQFLVSQYGAGQTTITAGAGVTLRSSGGKLKTSAQYAVATIIAISSTEFYVAGDLTA